ncbi:MAG: hypothetical protein KIG63_07480 [Methanobrevibacter sp.]|nr:hypothetical protein [Methanobrevibacter sp.]
MELLLQRKYKLSTYSIGKFFVDGVYFSDTLEDKDRNLYQDMSLELIKQAKVYDETAIPFGRYKITLVKSLKYSKKQKFVELTGGLMPYINNVPGWTGCLIHSGNTNKDTLGCILVGENKEKGKVINSFSTFKRLWKLLIEANERGEEIWLTVQP